MKNEPLDIAVGLCEIAGPIFVSLKEQVHGAFDGAGTHPEAKELTFTQLRILLAIQCGKNEVGRLASSARVAQPAMSKLVDHLIRLGFVRREPNPADRRRASLRLTPKGDATLGRVIRRAAEKYVPTIAGLAPADRRTLAAGVAAIRAVLEPSRAGGSAKRGVKKAARP